MNIIQKTLQQLAEKFDMEIDGQVYSGITGMVEMGEKNDIQETIEGGLIFLGIYLSGKLGERECSSVCQQYIEAFMEQVDTPENGVDFSVEFIKELKIKVFDGGNVNQVIRVGNTVRRQTGYHSYAEQLLDYIEVKGFNKAPKYIGKDDMDREILTFMEGEVSGDRYPNEPFYMWTDDALSEMARMLRDYHDATVGFKSTEVPEMIYPDDKLHEVVCHNDYSPYNMTFKRELPSGIFDFDMAGPGPRIWDIAYALYTCIPISTFQPDLIKGELVEYDITYEKLREKRIKLFFDTYGMEIPKELKNWVIKRIEKLCDTIMMKARDGEEAFINMVEDGHLEHYEKEIQFLKKHFPSV